MTCFDDLPAPTNLAKARSLALIDVIRQAMMDNNGLLPFSHFMSLALYEPALGYYSAEAFTIGRQGDFTTAPEISPLFARCFAKQCQQILQSGKTQDILELGPGTGTFACDLLTELSRLQSLPNTYYLYEVSENLRKKQRALLQYRHPDLMARIVWLEALPHAFKGVIVGNEVLDALPVGCFEIENNTPYERCVGWQDNQFIWQRRPAPPLLANNVMPLSLPDGYQSEINLSLPSYIQSICNSLEEGIILFADYGYGQREYYHPERTQGTLTCFYRHHKHANPLILPGLQDITAHVDFTRVIESASDAGCDLLGFCTQAGFLMATGLLDLAGELEQHLTPIEEFNLHQAVKLLTLPTEMGERIKIMALGKGIEMPLIGFSLQDRRREL